MKVVDGCGEGAAAVSVKSLGGEPNIDVTA
jgi:hypothetical protein